MRVYCSYTLLIHQVYQLIVIMSFMIPSLVGVCTRRINKQLLTHKASIIKQVVRNLNVHEYIACTLLKDAAIPTPPFGVAKTSDEAYELAKNLGQKDFVLKAQVLAGGRGRGHFENSTVGGVVMCDTPEQVRELATDMIGKKLITKQTGTNGRICNAVMVTTRMFPRKEYYIAIMLEQTFNGPVMIVSKQGGVEIEDIAAKNPNAIQYVPIDMKKGLTQKQMDNMANFLGLTGIAKEITTLVANNLYKLFLKKDALLLEINPFAEDVNGKYYALDCKCNFDDSAVYRQEKLFVLKDITQMDQREVQAEKYNLNYISLDGNIGCMVNGAGLAMATMDIIKLYGGLPANFLDVGGSATIEAVTEGFKILSSHPKVEAILVNIFGGIMRCDIIAQGIIDASKHLKLNIPVIVRLQGTNVDVAKKMIMDAKLKVFSEDEFMKAAEISVKMAHMINIARSLNLDIAYTKFTSARKEEK